MCSSKGRPERIHEMIDSFNENKSENTELIVYVSEDDPKLYDYNAALEKTNYIIGPNKPMCKVLNYICTELYPNIDFYQEINDDHVIRTYHWDKSIINGLNEKRNSFGYAYGASLNLPTSIVASGKLVRFLGYFFPKYFDQLYCDKYLRDVFKDTNISIYIPEVFVEHKHVHFELAKWDDTYRKVYSEGSEIIGQAAYKTWLEERELIANKINNYVKEQGWEELFSKKYLPIRSTRLRENE
jgi:hypothetical protein